MKKLKRIAIHSVPRSGSTWLGSIFDSSPEVAYRYQPLFSYGHKGQLSPTTKRPQIDKFFEDIFHSKDRFVLQKEAQAEGTVPLFEKQAPTHLVYKEVRYHHILENLLKEDKDIIVFGLVRNPLSVIFSWLNAPKEFRSDLGWDIKEEWYYAPGKNRGAAEEFYGFSKWKEVANLFSKLEHQFPQRFRTVRYSDLLADTEGQIQDIFDFCGLPCNKQTSDFIRESQMHTVDNAYSVYRANPNDRAWSGHLDQNISRRIFTELRGTPLEKYLDIK